MRTLNFHEGKYAVHLIQTVCIIKEGRFVIQVIVTQEYYKIGVSNEIPSEVDSMNNSQWFLLIFITFVLPFITVSIIFPDFFSTPCIRLLMDCSPNSREGWIMNHGDPSIMFWFHCKVKLHFSEIYCNHLTDKLIH